MKAHRRKELLATCAFVVAAAAALGAGVVFARNASSARQRTFEFAYQVRVPATVGSKGEERLWISLPQTDEHQSIRRLAIESRVAHEVGKEPECGNSYAVFHPSRSRRQQDTTSHCVLR